MIAHYQVNCPMCGGERTVTVKEYDYGVDPETGHHDAGRMMKCSVCGTELQDKEVREIPRGDEQMQTVDYKCWCCKNTDKSQPCECTADDCHQCGSCPMHCECDEGFFACECEYRGDEADARYCRVHGPNGLKDKRWKEQEAADNFAWAEAMRGVFED